MAEKMKISVGADVSELQQGMEQGKQSIEVFEKQVDDLNATIQDQIKNSKTLRQEQREAMTTVSKLTNEYMKLSNEEKRSAVGQEMAIRLHEAEEQAAKLIDASGDLSNRLRIMASDTRNLDIMKDTFEAVGSVATSILSGIAAVTGKQEDLNRAIAVFGTVQSTVNTVTKVANILNKDYKLMIGIQTLQYRALTKAKELDTAATGKATIAQRLFNTVAKANPYVLLATTAAVATAAIWGFIAATGKATDSISDEVKMAIEMNKISVQAKKDTISETVSLDLLYRKTQDTTKSINERKDAAKKLIDQYPNYFSNMTEEQIMLGNASGIYQQLKRDIIAVATAKAYQTKIEKDAARVIEIDAEIEQHRLQQERIRAQYSNLTQDQLEKGGGGMAGDLYRKEGAAINELIKEKENLTKQQEKYADKINETTDATQRLNNNTNVVSGSLTDLRNQANRLQKQLDDGLIPKDKIADTKKQIADLTKQANALEKELHPSKTTSVGDKNVEAAEGSIEKLEGKISDLQSKLKKGLIPAENIQSTLDSIKDLQSQVKNLKIKYGFEKPEEAKTKLEQLQDDLAKHTKAYEIAVDANDESARQAALEAIYKTQEEIDNHKVLLTIEPRTSDQERAKIQKDIAKIVDGAFKTDTPAFDFSALKEKLPEEMAAAVDRTLDEYNHIKDAREQLISIMNDENATDTAIAAAQKGLEQLDGKWKQVTEDVRLYNEANKEVEKVQETIDNVESSVNNLGSAFSSLGQITEDESINTAGIVAEAIANLSLSFAKAMKDHKSFTTWDWIAAGTAGLAQLLSMIAAVKSAQGYANGGVIGGHSYYGDKLIARVNSGETILTKDQTKNAVNAIDSNYDTSIQSINVQVSGRISGKDLLLVQKNTNTLLGSAGQSILL